MILLNQIIALPMQAIFIFAGLFGISFLIGFHEFGHFLFCKLFNIRTPSFSIGMGPKLLSKKIGDTLFILSAIPLGGYVEIAGAQEVGQGEQQEALSREDDSFAVKPLWQKILVMSGGILFNLAFSYFVYAALFVTGMPKTPLIYPFNARPIIQAVMHGSAAATYHLQAGDEILEINGDKINGNTIKLLEKIKESPKENAVLTINRKGNTKKINIIIGSRPGNQGGALGVIFEQQAIAPQPIGRSLRLAWNATNLTIKRLWQTIAFIFHAKKMDGLGGPIQIIADTVKGARKGFKIFLLLLAFISLNLAALNLLPIPIMDGGQILFYTIEAIVGRPLPERIKLIIHYICWFAVMALFALLTIKDVWRLIQPYTSVIQTYISTW